MKKILFLAIITVITIVSCKKDNVDNRSTLKKMYREYKNGEIDECKYNGEVVYTACLNAYDAGTIVYDEDGNKIGTCNYAWGPVESICAQLQDYEVIYRCKNHISGQPPVDKYKLGN